MRKQINDLLEERERLDSEGPIIYFHIIVLHMLPIISKWESRSRLSKNSKFILEKKGQWQGIMFDLTPYLENLVTY